MVAKLISPQGEVFELTDEQFYRAKAEFFPTAVKSSLEIIESLCGKYADDSELTAWYLEEKAKERALEDTKFERSANK